MLLTKEQNALAISHLPFVFKPNMSAADCVYVRQATIRYCNANGSNVYALMLDVRQQGTLLLSYCCI